MRRWYNSLTYAWKGLLLMVKEEPNMRIELCIAACVIGLGFWLKVSVTEWCVLLLCIGGVLCAEAFNSSIERLADHTTQEQHPDIGKVKDMAAAAVLIVAVISAVVGVMILGSRFVRV